MLRSDGATSWSGRQSSKPMQGPDRALFPTPAAQSAVPSADADSPLGTGNQGCKCSVDTHTAHSRSSNCAIWLGDVRSSSRAQHNGRNNSGPPFVRCYNVRTCLHRPFHAMPCNCTTVPAPPEGELPQRWPKSVLFSWR